jgi:hypothetical protein
MDGARRRFVFGMLLALLVLLFAIATVQTRLVPLALAALGENSQSVPVYLPAVHGPTFAARASASPQIQYLNDTTGTVFTFTVKNTSALSNIGAVEMSRPSN